MSRRRSLAPSLLSEIVVVDGNGHGSTNTRIRRFTTTQVSIGSDITYADSAADGATFTINASGLYAITYADRDAAANTVLGISRNSTELTTNVNDITAADLLGAWHNSVDGINIGTIIMRLFARDIIRAHTQGTMDETSDTCKFRIKRIL